MHTGPENRLRVDTNNNARALLIIQEEYPQVARALNLDNLDSEVTLGFIDTGEVPLSRVVGLEVGGEILKLSIADTWEEVRNREASAPAGSGVLDDRTIQDEHQRHIADFMKRKFSQQYSSGNLEAVFTELPAAPAFASELLELVLSNYKLHASNEPCPSWGFDPRNRGLLGGGCSSSDIVTKLLILSCARLSKVSHEFPFLINLDTAGTIQSGRLPVVDALLEVLLNEVVYCYATKSIQRNKIPEVVAELRHTLVEKELAAQVEEVLAAMDKLYAAQSELMAKVIGGCPREENEHSPLPVITWNGIEPPRLQIEVNRDPGYDDYLYCNGLAVIERSLKLAAFADSKAFGELLSLVSGFPTLKELLFPEIYGFFLYINKSSDPELLAKKIKDEPSATLTFTQEDKEAKQNLTIEDILSVAPMV